MGFFKELDIELQQVKQQPELEMEEVHKQEEQEGVIGYELSRHGLLRKINEMEDILRSIEGVVFEPPSLIHPRPRQDLEHLVSHMRTRLMRDAITEKKGAQIRKQIKEERGMGMWIGMSNAEIDAEIALQIAEGFIPKPHADYSPVDRSRYSGRSRRNPEETQRRERFYTKVKELKEKNKNAEIDAVEALGTLEDRVTALETWSEEVELEKENRS